MEFTEFVEKSRKLEHVYRVTQEVYDAFQLMSGDKNPLHTDANFAQEKGFASCVMYGNILNGFVSHFVGMILPTPNVMIQTQDIQYHKPIFMGDEILLKAEIEDESEAVRIVNYKLKFYRVGAEKPQQVAKGHVQVGLFKD